MDTKTLKKSDTDYRFAKVIGEGSFSSVYLAKEVDSGKEYAIKVCDKNFIFREKKQEYIKREKIALLRLNNTTGIVQLVCSFQTQSKLFFVTTYAKHGEITNFLKNMSLDSARFFAAELLIAIEEIHRKNIIHRDLKPQNIFLDKNFHLLVGDFGSCKIFSETQNDVVENTANHHDESRLTERPRKERRESFVGTAMYVSPEVLKGNLTRFSADLFSYGCIVFQMVCGRPAFGSGAENEYMIFQKIQNINYTFPENFHPVAKDLVKSLLVLDPDKRLGAHDKNEQMYNSIRNHEFFSNINFDKLYSQTSPMLILSDFQSDSQEISDDIEPGLGESQLRRILQLELNLSSHSSSSNSDTLRKLLEDQKKIPWSEFVEENEYIIKYGFVNKKKGLFPRRRMLLLTNTPRLIYIDANANVKKGEIPFSSSLACEPRNFKIFFVHTPNRIYNLEDTEGGALSWCSAIERVRDKYCRSN